MQKDLSEAFSLPLAEAVEMVRDGRITDVKTIAGLLWMARWGAEL